MDNSHLVEMVRRDCPFCNKIHPMEKRQRLGKMLIKNEPVEFDETYYLSPCRVDDDECEFVPAADMDRNLQNARNAYRHAHGLLTSDEIAAIRASYDMTQSDLAVLLGWGEVTITRYESKTIQDKTYDQILRLLYANPSFAFEQLLKQEHTFSADKYEHYKEIILERIRERGLSWLNKQTIRSHYAPYHAPSNLNGQKTLDLRKVGQICAFFAQNNQTLFKVKLMKLLWYVDALSYKLHNHAMTGLVYRHKSYGALPLAHNELLKLPGLSVQEREIHEATAHLITADVPASLDALSPDEIQILYLVQNHFQNMTTQEIVDYMHEEDAYQKTSMDEIIPFSLCATLKDFNAKIS